MITVDLRAQVRGVYGPRSELSLLVIDKDNGGKADSLNAGINFAANPLVCSVDADSRMSANRQLSNVVTVRCQNRSSMATSAVTSSSSRVGSRW